MLGVEWCCMLSALSDDLEVVRDTRQLGSCYAEGMQCRKLAPTQQGCDEGAIFMLVVYLAALIAYTTHHWEQRTYVCTCVHVYMCTCHKQDFGQ